MFLPVAVFKVKSLKTPPKGVKLTMEVCCLMFDVKPAKIKDPDSGKKVNASLYICMPCVCTSECFAHP